eukprot:scaffold2033_cov367-Prasinococcus_capsulatus_cf.AAC.18
MDVVRAQKKELRTRVKQELKLLSSEEIRRQSHLITETLIASALYRKSRVVAAYVSAMKLKEVDTGLLVKNILEDGKQCYVPRVLDSDSNLQFLQITDTSTDLIAVPPFGIEEPTEMLPNSSAYEARPCLSSQPQVAFVSRKDNKL